MQIKSLIFGAIALILAGTLTPLHAAAPVTAEQALIQGFARWQANRIEKIILNEAVDDIARDPYVKRFFPQASENIIVYSGSGASSKRLIPLMQFYLEEDVNRFKSLVSACVPSNIEKWFDAGLSLQNRSDNAVKLYGALKMLGEKPANLNAPYTVSSFIEEACPNADLTKTVKLSFSDAQIAQVATQISNYVQNNSGAVSISSGVPETFKKFITSKYLSYLFGAVSEYQKITDSTKNYSVRVHQMLLTIEKFGGISTKDYSGFRKLQNTSLFFASLLDAAKTKDPDAVVAILDSYVDDREAYVNKRFDNAYYSVFDVREFNVETQKVESVSYASTCRNYQVLPCRNSFFLSSYYGVSLANVAKEPGEDRELGFRAFGPVGFELKLLTVRSALVSINFAPIDIGNYITNELKDTDYSAKFEDIVAPSVFLSYSFKSKPVSLLLGYQYDIRIDENTETEGVFFSVGFDLPILTIF